VMKIQYRVAEFSKEGMRAIQTRYQGSRFVDSCSTTTGFVREGKLAKTE